MWVYEFTSSTAIAVSLLAFTYLLSPKDTYLSDSQPKGLESVELCYASDTRVLIQRDAKGRERKGARYGY